MTLKLGARRGVSVAAIVAHMTADDSDREWKGMILRGRLRSAHVAGLGFALVVGVGTAWLDWPVLWIIAGVCFGVSGVAGLLSGGAFFIQSKTWSFMAHAMCLPFVAAGLGGVFVGVARLVGWLD